MVEVVAMLSTFNRFAGGEGGGEGGAGGESVGEGGGVSCRSGRRVEQILHCNQGPSFCANVHT